ncbi:hypothetical protein [Dendronalium sp. ChiSLP03b]|uniref:hypothetical protein n=1 Tax=Dendronalium sp. ChiSLP03b TaxID=3075381 RepID=UPI002AD4B82E|nr:hypothetical protein [Dendronalium sp. ChiSLP03b]MDZ8208630.1 hypothetical protein [Dendronalium sp. ChiSLP03b]
MTQIQESPPKENTGTEELVQEAARNEESPTASFDKKNFAAMNGVNIEINAVANQQQEVPQPEEIITTRTVSQNPVLKMAVIGGGILIFIMLIGGVISGSMNALNLATTKQIEPVKSLEVVESPEIKDETGQTKTALALTSQNVELKKLRDLKATPEATATPTPSPISKPVAVTAAPTPTTPIQRTQPISVPRNPTPPPPRRINTPTTRPSVVAPVRESQSQPRVTKAVSIAPVKTQKTQQLDPMQQWLAASNIGSFSANSNSTNERISDELSENEGIEGGITKPTSTSNVNASKNTNKQTQEEESENVDVDYGRARVLVGTRAVGRLETPVVWTSTTENQSNQNYLVQLTQPLKAADGSEALPKGSYIVAVVYGGSQSQYIQLQAVSALINTNGNTEEKSLPPGAVLILAKNGSLLKAESRKGSDLGRTVFSSVLAGVAKAAQIQNNPTSQITTSSYGYSSSTTTNDSKDLVAGFAEGTLGEIVRGIQTNNQRQAQQLQDSDKVFVIEAGKSLQIFVNQSINL